MGNFWAIGLIDEQTDRQHIEATTSSSMAQKSDNAAELVSIEVKGSYG